MARSDTISKEHRMLWSAISLGQKDASFQKWKDTNSLYVNKSGCYVHESISLEQRCKCCCVRCIGTLFLIAPKVGNTNDINNLQKNRIMSTIRQIINLNPTEEDIRKPEAMQNSYRPLILTIDITSYNILRALKMYIVRQETVFNSKQWQTYFLKINLFIYLFCSPWIFN